MAATMGCGGQKQSREGPASRTWRACRAFSIRTGRGLAGKLLNCRSPRVCNVFRFAAQSITGSIPVDPRGRRHPLHPQRPRRQDAGRGAYCWPHSARSVGAVSPCPAHEMLPVASFEEYNDLACGTCGRRSVPSKAGWETRLDAGVFSVNYFCRLASTIFAGSGRRESRSTTMTPVGRVGVACDVQSGVENALPRRCRVAPLLARVFHAAGAVHRLLGFRSIPAFRRSTVGGRGAAADPEHVPGEQAPRGISGGTGPCGSSGRRTQACSA